MKNLFSSLALLAVLFVGSAAQAQTPFAPYYALELGGSQAQQRFGTGPDGAFSNHQTNYGNFGTFDVSGLFRPTQLVAVQLQLSQFAGMEFNQQARSTYSESNECCDFTSTQQMTEHGVGRGFLALANVRLYPFTNVYQGVEPYFVAGAGMMNLRVNGPVLETDTRTFSCGEESSTYKYSGLVGHNPQAGRAIVYNLGAGVDYPVTENFYVGIEAGYKVPTGSLRHLNFLSYGVHAGVRF